MQYLRKLSFILFLTGLISGALGQQAINYNMPEVVQPSPQSQAFTRYGDYPMSDYTGLTDISVPIHTITGKKLSLPINMSFHSSGRMANEINGILGMRWTLNCGGLVTRIMKGAPDEWTAGRIVPYTVNPYHVPTFEELYSACPDGKLPQGPGLSWYDTEFDIWSYVLPNGKQGHFILKNNNGVKVPMMIPYSPLQIAFAKGSHSNDQYERIEITDVDGTKYIFGGDAWTSNALETTPEWDQQEGLIGNVTTGWYLTKIVSSDGTDEISLSYASHIATTYNASQVANIGDDVRDASVLFTQEDCDLDAYECSLMDYILPYHFDQQNYRDAFLTSSNPRVPHISGIQFAGGSVTFNYTTAPSNGPYDNSNKTLLSEIIFNKESGQFKKVKFNASLHPGEVDIYYLDNLSFYGEDNNDVKQKYDFSYYDGGGIAFPVYYAAMYKDWWGYAAAPAGLNSLLPFQTVGLSARWAGPGTIDVGFSINRDASEQYKTWGMLQKITYPTGGETEFVYEDNRYDIGNSASWPGPGLRIKEVISRPNNGGKDIHKIYKYGETENGNGFIDENVRPGSYSRKMLMATQGVVMHFWEYWVDLGEGSNQSIPWDFPEQAGYRNRDYFSDPYIRYDFPGSPIKYDVVREYYLEDYIPKQKTESRYSWPYANALIDFTVTDHEEQIDYPRKFSDPQYAWQTPTLDSKTWFKYSNGQFDPVKKESYFYTADEREEAWDMPTYLHTNVVWERHGSSSYGTQFENMKKYHEQNTSLYGYGYRRFVSGMQNVYETKTEEFTPSGTVTVVKDMTYDPWSNLLKTEEVLNSKHELTKTTFTYPNNYPNVPVYQQMVLKNILTPVIETTTSVDGVQTKKAVTNFYNPAANVFVPQSVENQTGDKPREVIASFNRYDAQGHILEQQKSNNVTEVYLWGYQSRYPVAKILNTTFDIANAKVTQSVLDGATGMGDDAALKAHLDNLRTIPGALVETYTYKPQIGMTSSTDANGITTYYEYDNFGRLLHIRDKDNNILKKYEYQYQYQCATCGASAPNWQTTGNTRHIPCAANPAYNGLYAQREEKDMNPASPTYNLSRWLDYQIPWNDPLYDASLYRTYEENWVNTATPPRCIQISGQNTGEQEQEQTYQAPNPCSISQNSLRWTNIGKNTNACPLPPFFTPSRDWSGNYTSSLCVLPAEPDPVYIPVPNTFTSTISVDDADDQALQYAQSEADRLGTCTVPPINFSLINNSGTGMTVTLTNIATNQDYVLHSVNGANAYYQNLPQGIYNIYIEPAFNDDWIYYQLGCDYFTEIKGELWVNEIPINANCNTINAN